MIVDVSGVLCPCRVRSGRACPHSPSQLVPSLAAEGLEVLARTPGAHRAHVAGFYPRLSGFECFDRLSGHNDSTAAFPAGETRSYGYGSDDVLAVTGRRRRGG